MLDEPWMCDPVNEHRPRPFEPAFGAAHETACEVAHTPIGFEMHKQITDRRKCEKHSDFGSVQHICSSSENKITVVRWVAWIIKVLCVNNSVF